ADSARKSSAVPHVRKQPVAHAPKPAVSSAPNGTPAPRTAETSTTVANSPFSEATPSYDVATNSAAPTPPMQSTTTAPGPLISSAATVAPCPDCTLYSIFAALGGLI